MKHKMKSMKQKLRTPMLVLIVIFPLVALLLFNIAMRLYIDRSAKSELRTVAQSMEIVVRREFPGSLRNATAENLNGAVARVYKALRAANLSNSMEMLLFSRNRDLLYPSEESEMANKELTVCIAAKLPSMQKNRVYELRAGTTRYFVLAYPLTNLAGERPTIVFVSRTSGLALVRTMNWILFSLLLVGIAIASWIAARLSSRVALPVSRLCELTKSIGDGGFEPIPPPDEDLDIFELHTLYQSFADMSARLEAYDHVQKTFLQNASHELRTPLMSIQGYAEGIVDNVLPDTKAAAGIIRDESVRLNGLVEELLTLSRIESGTYATKSVPINLSDILREYAQRLGGFAARQQKRLALTLPDEPVFALADDSLLFQAVMNTVSNCLRYAHSSAEITLLRVGREAVIRVTDDGGGIAEDELPHVFERFYKGKGGNFGLGLAIAKSAVECMGGHIHAYNDETGAVFEIVLLAKNVA